MDKLDYIMRDSVLTGIGMPTIDTKRLFRNMYLDKNYSLVFTSRAIPVLQNMIDSRDGLYLYVYNHHAVVFSDFMNTYIVRKLSHNARDFLHLAYSGASDEEMNNLLEDLEISGLGLIPKPYFFSVEAIVQGNRSDSDWISLLNVMLLQRETSLEYITQVLQSAIATERQGHQWVHGQPTDDRELMKKLARKIEGTFKLIYNYKTRNFLKPWWKTVFEFSNFMTQHFRDDYVRYQVSKWICNGGDVGLDAAEMRSQIAKHVIYIEKKWLRIQGNNLFGKKEHKVYDIIVAPLHYSNTVFVEEVNNCLFSNAALVLHFDADREFRMNVMAKYSSVQQLYDNPHKSNEKAEINYHYIDDTIVSGRTYQRMKSLIGSLIRPEAESSVEINIFKSVVLLLNRMSKSSMKDYIDDPNYFMAYFNLGISSMRVNSDACILCKKYSEWNKLSEQASLNEVYTFWQNKSSNIVCKPVEELDFLNGHSLKGPNYVKHPERAIQYMIASHRAKILLDEICAYENADGIIKNIVEKLFPESVYPPDELIAMLKILGRPFMTFRREEKEAVFKLMLMMLDALLKDQCPEGDDKLSRLLREIYSDCDIHVKIVQMLINRLAELESNAIIRKRNLELILAFAGEYGKGEEYEEFTSNYLNRIKQLTGQSKDYTKGLYLEYILLYGEEYGGILGSNMNMSVLKKESREASFYRKLYLENTKLANYGIEYLADCFWSIKDYTQDNMKQILNGNYYFDNFIQYLAFHKVVNMDEKMSVESFASQAEFDKLVGMVRFELFYQRIFGRKKISGLEDTGPEDEVSGEKGAEEIRYNIQDKFVEMIEYLKAASGASDGEIIVPYEKDNEYTDGSPKYIALNMGKGRTIREFENDEQKLLDFMREDRKFEGDTYAICSHGGKGKWVLFKFYNKTGTGNNAMVIYMLFPFETEDMGELLHAVKNILIFRRKIWNILNLSSDALLQSLSDNLFYKQQMLKSRSVGHMEFSESLDQLEYVCEIVNNDAYTDKSKQDKELITKYFELVVNNLISFMNAQLLGGKGAEYTDPCPPEICFDSFWKKHDYVFKALTRVWKLTISLDTAYTGDCCIRPVDTMDKMIPSQKVLLIMFLAVFQNIRKHCETDAQEIECGVYIEQVAFSDANRPCLCIKNKIPSERKQHIEEMISPGAYRVTNGISLAIIFDTCRAYYPETRYSDIFCVLEEEQEEKQHENSGKSLEFVVKLPILI